MSDPRACLVCSDPLAPAAPDYGLCQTCDAALRGAALERLRDRHTRTLRRVSEATLIVVVIGGAALLFAGLRP